jgi:hypothetical protein
MSVSVKASLIRRATNNFSAMRERIGVTDMGRNSEREKGLETLGTGVTIAVSQLNGTVPERKL